MLSSPGAFSSRATLSRFCCGLALVNQSTVKSLKRSFHKKPERMHHLFLPSLKMGTIEERKTSLFYAICSGDTLYSISRRNYSSYIVQDHCLIASTISCDCSISFIHFTKSLHSVYSKTHRQPSLTDTQVPHAQQIIYPATSTAPS